MSEQGNGQGREISISAGRFPYIKEFKDHPDAQMKRKLSDEYGKEWYYEHCLYLVSEGYNPNEQI